MTSRLGLACSPTGNEVSFENAQMKKIKFSVESRRLRPGDPGRAGRARLDRQVAALAAQVTRQPGWRHVATYGDQEFRVARPGLSRLLAEAPGRFDLLAADGHGRLSPNRRVLDALLAQLGGGVRVVVLRPSAGRRFVRFMANMALADMIGEAAR